MKTYNDKLNEKMLKDQHTQGILGAAIFLYQYFPDDKEMMEIALPILRIFEKKGLIIIDEVEDKSGSDNVLDFQLHAERRKLLRSVDDD